MTKKKNPHIGSSLESWLDEAGIREEVDGCRHQICHRAPASQRDEEKEAVQKVDGGIDEHQPCAA